MARNRGRSRADLETVNLLLLLRWLRNLQSRLFADGHMQHGAKGNAAYAALQALTGESLAMGLQGYDDELLTAGGRTVNLPPLSEEQVGQVYGALASGRFL